MSSSKFQLKQTLHYTSDTSKDGGYKRGKVTVYQPAPDKTMLEMSEEPIKKCSEIVSLEPSHHDNILCVGTKDGLKFLSFDSRSDKEAWNNTIEGLIQSSERSRPRPKSVQERPRNPRDNARMCHSSPAAPDEMFKEMVHRERPLNPVSPNDNEPLYENSNFDLEITNQRDAYLYAHKLKQLQEENHQHLEVNRESVKHVEQDFYEEVCPISQPQPLMSNEDRGLTRKQALLPPKKKGYGPPKAAPSEPHPNQKIKQDVDQRSVPFTNGGKGRRPMPPPKERKPKQLLKVSPQPQADDDLYANANEFPLNNDGRELEAKCHAGKDRCRPIYEKDGSVSSVEVRVSVQIPIEEYRLGDITLGDNDGNIIVETTRLPRYLNAGDQLLQINAIDVTNTVKDFALICLNRVNSEKINLEILRRFHQC